MPGSAKKNHGMTSEKVPSGTVKQAYGKDSSDVTMGGERGGSMGGGESNLSHSLSGAKAKQRIGNG